MKLSPAEISFWVALIVSGVLAVPILRLLIALKSRQTVSQYAPEGHAKKQGTPTMGGLIIAVGFIASQLAVLGSPTETSYPWSFGDSVSVPQPRFNSTLFTLVLFLLFALIGFVDDFVVPRLFPGKRGLGWKQKIVMQFVAALVYAVPTYIDSWPKIVLAVFLILFFANAYNFSDGLDGLSGTLLMGLAVGLIGIALYAQPSHSYLCLFALLGAVIPFLFLNAPPAKVFMGDVGSLGIGAVFGAVVMGISLHGESSWDAPLTFGMKDSGSSFTTVVALFVVSIVMIVELVPVPLQIASVKLRKGRKLFLYTPIHHAFEKIGWPESRVVWMYALTQLVLSAIAIQIAHLGVEGLPPR